MAFKYFIHFLNLIFHFFTQTIEILRSFIHFSSSLSPFFPLKPQSSAAAMSVLSRLCAVARPLRHCRRESPIAMRSYGSAAAVEVDYDYYEDDEEFERASGDRSQGRAMADSRGWVPRRGVQWVVLGDPGAKKHVYAERLSKLLDVPHISMGSLVRQELNPRSSIYQQVLLLSDFPLCNA